MDNKSDLFLSLQELIQLPDLSQAAVGEFADPVMHHGSLKSKAFCSKCGMNWASLWTEDDELNDESYEYCPLCNTDFFLEDPLDGPLYVYKKFQGIMNVVTGKPYTPPVRQINELIQYRRNTRKPFDRERWERERPLREEFGLYAIDEYQKAFATGGQPAGQVAFNAALKINFDTWLKDIKGIDRETI